MTGKKQRLGIGLFLWVLFIIGICSQQVSAFDFSAPYTDVNAWIDGDAVYVRVYDPARGQWQETSYPGSSPHSLTNQGGVVAWIYGNDDIYVRCTVYDPIKGSWESYGHGSIYSRSLSNNNGVVAWVHTNSDVIGYTVYDLEKGSWVSDYYNNGVEHTLVNKDGVVAWLHPDDIYVQYAVYDPLQGRWETSFIECSGSGSLTTGGGVVAWIHSHGDYLRFSVYDPVAQRWDSHESPGSNTTSVSISASTVSFVRNGNTSTRGYNYQTGIWTSSPTVPVAKFIPSTPWESNGQQHVHFLDFSLEATSYSWDFGDGNYSTEQTPYHIFSPGVYTITQNISGPHGSHSVSEQFITDFEAPSGTVSIENGAATTYSSNVILYLDVTDNSGNVESMRFGNSSSSYGAWQPYLPTASFSLNPGTGTRYVYAQFRDEAGNISGEYSDSIVVEEPLSITITEPDPWDTFYINTTSNIEWSTSGEISSVRIEYSTDGGYNWTTITNSTSNTGSYSWNVPDTPSSNCRIRISDTGGTTSTTSSIFTINSSTITVTSPPAGLILQHNSTYGITWNYNGPINNIHIHLSTDGGSSWQTVATNQPISSPYQWPVPTVTSSNCIIRLQDTGGLATGYSGVFTIAPPPPGITVSNPQNSDNRPLGQTHTITWSYVTIPDTEPVNIELLQNGGVVGAIAQDIPISQCSFDWTVGSHSNGTATPASDYSVRVVTTGSPAIQDDGATFRISDPLLTVTAPNGGEVFYSPSPCTITWTAQDMEGDIDISLYQNGALYSAIGTVDASTGSFTWDIPRTLPTGHDYTIHISQENTAEDTSDTAFSIIKKVTPDFNNDGHPDLLWRHTGNGKNLVWYMNGATVEGFGNIDTLAVSDWKLAGTGDFNGDQKVDLLWRNTSTGQNTVWYLDGTTLTGFGALPKLMDFDWELVGTGDFDYDGKVDLLWRNLVDGRHSVWYLDGVTVKGFGNLPQAAALDWHIVGTGDFNGDNKVDLLWWNSISGKLMVWLLDGTGIIAMQNITPGLANFDWRVAGVADMNGDSKPDILWRNYTSGANNVWYLDGVTLIESAGIGSTADLQWKLLNNGEMAQDIGTPGSSAPATGAPTPTPEGASQSQVTATAPEMTVSTVEDSSGTTGSTEWLMQMEPDNNTEDIQGPYLGGFSTSTVLPTAVAAVAPAQAPVTLEETYYVYTFDGKLLAEYAAGGQCQGVYLHRQQVAGRIPPRGEQNLLLHDGPGEIHPYHHRRRR